ncbi:MAG: hypothetical protein DIZ80_14370 [endosymbiont of Galathealinum brachiosum]|uniref:histidine kinase n=1 Tax=endosymbiont of Galathealinum brachiosum TaxID=2200906 RepID=A0A370D8P9_9GAMM|nr:MAG: hypothetical protein DIZ80_14370 [endosymbiont of Galathealinum brachiosum]
MIVNKIWPFLTKSVRRQLVLGVVMVHAVLMSLFILDVSLRQQDVLLNEQVSYATALAKSVSTSSGGWLLSHDVTGLQEIIDAQRSYPELNFAMAVDEKGLILAHTDRQRRGQFITDLPDRLELTILFQTAELVDVVTPVIVAEEHVGWIRIGIAQHTTQEQIKNIVIDGVIYALVAIVVGMVLANIMGIRLTRKLYGIQEVATDIEKGLQTDRRAPAQGTDEAAQLARQFNRMLDTLEQREKEIITTHNALHKSEARYSRSLRGSNDGLWEWNIPEDYVYYSPRWKSMLGYDDDELEYTFETWERLTHSDDIERVKSKIKQCMDGLARKFEVEFRMQHKNGSWVYVLSRGELERDKDGTPKLMSGTHVDITKRVEAEKLIHQQQLEQQHIIESMLETLITVNENGDIQNINHAGELLFGYDNEELKNKELKYLISDVDVIKHYLNKSGDYISESGLEVITQNKKGENLRILCSVTDLSEVAGEKQRYIISCHDVTRLKQQEELLRHSQKMEALGKLTGGIAHDFNNMLSVILGYSELLQNVINESSTEYRYIKEINTAGERAKKLTGNLLAFSRKKAATEELVDLNQLLHDDKNMLAKTLTVRIHLDLLLEESIWPIVLDKRSLEDAILNLCINAMHAMPEGGTLTISTKNIKLEISDVSGFDVMPGEYVLLVIKDTGTGMDDKTRENMFDPFFTTKGDMGTGLGLSQVYGFVKQAKGLVNVNTKIDRGTEILIYFPRAKQSTLSSLDSSSVAAVMPGKGDETILVVDDESSICLLNREILSSHGYCVLIANSGKEALEILKKEKVDLLLSDVIMPNMDGYHLASLVQKLYPEVIIQILSGYDDDQEFSSEVTDLYKQKLVKPVDVVELLKTIRTKLDDK